MVHMESTWSRSIIGWIIDLVDRPSQAHYWLKCIRFANQLRFLIARQSYPPDHPAPTLPHCSSRNSFRCSISCDSPIFSEWSDLLFGQSVDTVAWQFAQTVYSGGLLWLYTLMVYPDGLPWQSILRMSFWQSVLTTRSILAIYPFSLPFRFTLSVYSFSLPFYPFGLAFYSVKPFSM